MIRVCCVCRKEEIGGRWQEGRVPVVPGASHVYCPQCYDDLMDLLDRYVPAQPNKAIFTVRTVRGFR